MTTVPRLPAPTTDAFGARLALIRWQMGWNQKEAAMACGLPHGSWREWELSNRAPRATVAQKIAAATGIDDYWILTGNSRDAVSVSGGDDPTPGGKAPTDQYLLGTPCTVTKPVRLIDHQRGIVRSCLTESAA